VTIVVRRARRSDIAEAVALVQEVRASYEALEPRFWRRASNAASRTRVYFNLLLLSPRAWILVAEDGGSIVGLLAARRIRVPAVYDPGGPALLIDDFLVSAADRWPEIGGGLLAELRRIARAKNYAQIIAVAAVGDRPKMEFMRASGLSHTSSWWTGAA
jgi:predicted N-acetyltransferase YhbS